MDLSNCDLKEIPENFGDLKSLQHLDLSHNVLLDLPRSFFRLTSLENLKFEGNDIGSFIDSINQLSSLKKLNIKLNGLKMLPNSLLNLKNLRKLNIQLNPILDYKDWIKKLAPNGVTVLVSEESYYASIEFSGYDPNFACTSCGSGNYEENFDCSEGHCPDCGLSWQKG